jgi:putative hemolysin
MRRSIGLIFLAVVALGPDSVWALANPASVFCVQSGGKSELRKGPRGQYGVCRLPDGRVVDEWKYFRTMRSKPANR